MTNGTNGGCCWGWVPLLGKHFSFCIRALNERQRTTGLAIFVMAFSVLAHASNPAAPLLWRGIEPGPYHVGYKSAWKWDASRAFSPRTDWRGNVLYHEAARPIRLSTWYPATPHKGSTPMPYEGYFHADDAPAELHALVQATEEYDRSSNANMFGGDAILLQQLLRTTTAAYRDASYAQGAFPVVIYSMGQNDYNQENVVLCEFLASHGFIVVTVADLGPSLLKSKMLVNDASSFEAQEDDLEFALAQAIQIPSADANKIAALGHSMGAIYALLLAMRDDRVGAVIGLDGSYMTTIPRYYFKFQEAFYFDPTHFRAPLLSLYRKDDNPDATMSEIDQLRYSDRYLMAVPKVIHTDFNSFPLLTVDVPASKLDTYASRHRDQQTAVSGHLFIANSVLDFLEGTLNGNPQSIGSLQQRCQRFSLAGTATDCKLLPGLRAPTEEELARIAMADGTDQAVAAYDDAKARYPEAVIIREKVLNRIGSEAGYQDHREDAVKILQLNVHAWPDSSDAYESLAEAYEANGQKDLALESYKKSLALNPGNADAREGLKRLQTARQ
jgi:dienelactone hydrolase